MRASVSTWYPQCPTSGITLIKTGYTNCLIRTKRGGGSLTTIGAGAVSVSGFVNLLWLFSSRCFHCVSAIVPVVEGVTVVLDDQGREGIPQIEGAFDFI